MTVCRNVHANTPYCIWNSILDRIFKLNTGVSVSLSVAFSRPLFIGRFLGKIQPNISRSVGEDLNGWDGYRPVVSSLRGQPDSIRSSRGANQW